MKHNSPLVRTSSRMRLGIVLAAGLAAVFAMMIAGLSKYALLAGLDITALMYITLVALTVWSLDPNATKIHAIRENPGRALSDLILIIASLGSLITVAFIIADPTQASGLARIGLVLLGITSIVLGWLMVHVLYMLSYARHYYGGRTGGIDFGHDKPNYVDFAYLAFTIGMTFQVSDTTLQSREIRRTALHQALLSYVFGTVIVATTINLVAGLGK
jgi:uncharacterized membrane protein